jgi:hypothetical protein
MGKYTDNQSDIYAIFDSAGWQAEGIETVPQDYKGDITTEEYIRVSIVPRGAGINRVSTSGVVIAEIYTPAGFGPSRQNFIADRLDAHLANQSKTTGSLGMTQFLASSLSPLGTDRENTSLQCAKYEIPFNFFGVLN